MALSNDPLYQATVEIRISVYGHSDIWFGYFTIRQLTWQGDKEAVKYLIKHDPTFLEVYQQFIKERMLERKLSLYEKTAAITTAPVGAFGLTTRR